MGRPKGCEDGRYPSRSGRGRCECHVVFWGIPLGEVYFCKGNRLKFQKQHFFFCRDTLPETNIAHENGRLEDYIPFGMAFFVGIISVFI